MPLNAQFHRFRGVLVDEITWKPAGDTFEEWARTANEHITRTGCGVQAPPEPCQCHRCREQWRTWDDQQTAKQKLGALFYRRMKTRPEVESILSTLRHSILDKHASLQLMVNANGDSILKQWRKKTSTERASLLKDICPAMAVQRWQKEERLGVVMEKQDQETFRTSLLLPYLSVDDLSTDVHKLMFLLHLRSAYHPEALVQIDKAQTAFAWCYAITSVFYSPLAVSMVASTYGQPLEVNYDLVHRWLMCGFPRAHLILEAQDTLLTFLCDMSARLIDDGTQIKGHLAFSKLIKNGLKHDGLVELSSPYLNQPFATPPQMDIDRLIQLGQTRLDIAMDDVWLLQTDLIYMNATLRDAISGLSPSSNKSRIRTTLTREQEYCRFALHLIRVNLASAARWRGILLHCQSMHDVLECAEEKVAASSAHRTSVESSLQELDDMLMQALLDKINTLGAIIARIPGVHDHLTIYESEGGLHAIYDSRRVNFIELQQAMFKDNPILYAIFQLTQTALGNDEYRLEKIDFQLSRSMSIIDHFLRRRVYDSVGSHGTRKLDDQTMTWLADTIALHEMLVSLRAFQPAYPLSAKRWTPADYFKTHIFELDIELRSRDEGKLSRLLRHFHELPQPVGRKDATWLERRDARFEALDEFWAAVEAIFERQPVERATKLAKRTRALLGASNEPEYQRKREEEREKILDSRKAQSDPTLTAYEVQAQWGEEPASSGSICKVKKLKEGEARSHFEAHLKELSLHGDSMHPDCATGADVTVTKIPVQTEHLKTLRRLFPAPSGEDVKTGLVTWQKFAKAMVDVGFSATHSGGSAVNFASSAGSIAIHKPHPEPKLDNVMLHIIGKRMERHFGWTFDSFSERSEPGR